MKHLILIIILLWGCNNQTEEVQQNHINQLNKHIEIIHAQQDTINKIAFKALSIGEWAVKYADSMKVELKKCQQRKQIK